MLRRMFAGAVIAVALTLVASAASAEDVSSVYPTPEPLQWSGPSIGFPGGYYLTAQGQPALEYILGPDAVPQSLGGITSSDMDASQGGDFLVVRGADGAVWLNTFVGPGFGGWVSLGGQATSGPSVASFFNSGRRFVVARGGDNALWVNELTGEGPLGWISAGGSLSSDPDAAIGPDGLLYVTARGDDGVTWINAYDGIAWGGWASLGGFSTSGPSIGYNASDGYVLTRGGDGAIWANHLTPAGWGGWFLLGGETNIQPPGTQGGYAIDVYMDETGDFVSFATIGADGHIWDGFYSAATGPAFRQIG